MTRRGYIVYTETAVFQKRPLLGKSPPTFTPLPPIPPPPLARSERYRNSGGHFWRYCSGFNNFIRPSAGFCKSMLKLRANCAKWSISNVNNNTFLRIIAFRRYASHLEVDLHTRYPSGICFVRCVNFIACTGSVGR